MTGQTGIGDPRHLRSLRGCYRRRPLAIYDPDAITIPSAYASSYGMGAVLLQLQPDGRRAAIVYASTVLLEAICTN